MESILGAREFFWTTLFYMENFLGRLSDQRWSVIMKNMQNPIFIRFSEEQTYCSRSAALLQGCKKL